MSVVRRAGAVAAAVLVLAGCSSASSPAPTGARLLVSSADDSSVRLVERAPSSSASAGEIVVDAAAPGQTWRGTGAALTDDAVDQLAGRPELIDLLLDPAAERGARLDWLRLPLSATDYSADDWAWDWSESDGASPSPEAERALDLLREEVLPVAPDLRLVATPWTAPPSMKEPAQWHGGSLRDDAVPSYASMLVDQASWLVDEGYPLAALTLANEPGLTGDYPTMLVSDEQLAGLARLVGPPLRELGVELWAVDHNWSDRDRVDAALTSADYDAVAFHCYDGEPEQAAGLAVPWLVTECTGTTDDALGTLAWDTDVLVDRAVDAGSTGLLMWNPVLPRGFVGRSGGCPDCRGLLTLDPAPVPEPEFYVLAHLARAARPGDRVLPVTGPPGLSLVAFARAGGALTVLGYRPGDRPVTVRFRVGDGAAGASYRIGAHELFTWTGPVD
jgi:glucosylceramidase